MSRLTSRWLLVSTACLTLGIGALACTPDEASEASDLDDDEVADFDEGDMDRSMTSLRSGADPKRGLFRQLWLGPDLVSGKGTGQKVHSELKRLLTASYWDAARSKMGGFQLRIGFLRRIFRPDCSIQPGAAISLSDLKSLAQVLNSTKTPVAVEVGGFRVTKGIDAEALKALSDQGVKLHTPPSSALINHYVRAYAQADAQNEYRYLKCWKDVGGRIDLLILDNPMSWGLNQQLGIVAKDKVTLSVPLNQGRIFDAIVEYILFMKRADHLPKVQFGWTEFLGFTQVVSPRGTVFHQGALTTSAYKQVFGTNVDLDLGSILDGLVKRLWAHGLSLESYYLDYDVDHESADRVRYAAKPYERVLAAEHIVRMRGIKVGAFVNAWEDGRELCNAEESFTSCTEYLKAAHKSYDGVHFAELAMEQIRNYMEQRVQEKTLAYLEQYFKYGGKASRLIYEVWQDYPETLGPEEQPRSYMNTAVKLGRVITPSTLPAGQTLFKIAGKAVLLATRDEVCAFKTKGDYDSYLRKKKLTDSVLPVYGNPPADLTWTGLCKP